VGENKDDTENLKKVIIEKSTERHIKRHLKPNPNKAKHGVYKDDYYKTIETAWKNRHKGKCDTTNDFDTFYLIPHYNAGDEGGTLETGKRLDYMTIVVHHGTSKVKTAFPSDESYEPFFTNKEEAK